MFDTVDYFQTIIDYYNTNRLCDKCWEFDVGRRDHTNIKQWTDENKCCVQMFLEYFKETDINKIDSDGLGELDYLKSDFELFIGLNSDFTKQLYQEVEPDKRTESKYTTYLKPIKTCIAEMFKQDLCAGITYGSISREMKLNYKDQNLDGWIIKGSLRFYEGTDAYPTTGAFTDLQEDDEEEITPQYLNRDLNFDLHTVSI